MSRKVPSVPLRAGLVAVALSAGALTAAPGAAAQARLPVPELGDSARVSLISVLPGDQVYSVFGHSALRVRDPELGIDRSYNFGTFEFGESPLEVAGFVGRFLYGDLLYSLTVQDPEHVLEYYWEVEGRAALEQTLALTRDEAQELFRLLEVNALPENRHYQYDFFFDNCATRLLDAVDAVLGPRLTFEAQPPGRSFRQLLDPFLTDARWVDLGMDLGLGIPADRPATAREAAFLPEHLADYFAAGRIDRDGRLVPLVRGTEQLTGPPSAGWRPGTDLPWPVIAAWTLFALAALATWRDARAGRRSRPAADAALFGALGVAGLAVCFLWFVSLHAVTDLNLNLAWALPTHLLVAVALARKRAGRAVGLYLAVTAALALALLLGMPFWPQELPAAVAPLLALVVLRAGWLARGAMLPRRESTP